VTTGAPREVMRGVRRGLRRLVPGPRTPAETSLRRRIVREGGSLAATMPGPAWRKWENRALQSDTEVDEAIRQVVGLGLVPHRDRPKNWDLMVALGAILEVTPRRGRILEMGAARYSPLLVWLYQYGRRRLNGIDLIYDQPVRKGPIRFEQMDLTATTFPDGAFDAIACLSVIEHGVDVTAYLREARRLLRPGGILITSTDYWDEPMETGDRVAYGHPVRIFDRAGIEAFLAEARQMGFRTRVEVDLACRDRVVHWERVDLDYTFVVIVLEAPAGDRERRDIQP
jgi:hypothetical protein